MATAAPDAELVPLGTLTPPNPSARFPLLLVPHYPRAAWDADFYAQAVLAEFGASGWAASLDAAIDPPPSDPAAIAEEIAVLLNMANQRVRLEAEIVAQATDPRSYWGDLLMVRAATRPGTWTLIASAIAVGHMVAMHYKLRFRRPRPVQVYPALMPMMQTPRHPSYPNGHALEGTLVTLCIETVLPALAGPESVLRTLARRVGENREVAGLHYPSDRVASERLAPEILAVLARGALFQSVQAEARAEWEGVTAIAFPFDAPGPVPETKSR